MIPKLLHQIWIGPNPLPDDQAAWIDGWRGRHPSWEHRLWRDEVRDALPFPLQQLYDAARSWAHKADVARYWLIYKFGGVYVDTDFECLHAIDELLAGCRAFVCRAADAGHVTNALFGAVPEHPLLEVLLHALPQRFTAASPVPTGPRLMTDIAQGCVDVRVFEKRLFYPIEWGEQQRFVNAREFPGAYGVHHFHASWVKP